MRLHKKVPSLAEEELDPLVSAQANDDAVWTRLARVRKTSAPLSQRGMTQLSRHFRMHTDSLASRVTLGRVCVRDDSITFWGKRCYDIPHACRDSSHNRWYDHESDTCLWLSHGAA